MAYSHTTNKQQLIADHCDNPWEQNSLDVGAVISGIGVLLLIVVVVLYVASVYWADGHSLISTIIHNVANFNLVDWLMGLPEYTDYVQ